MDSGFYAAIAAIIAPVLTALINNRHHYRMRKIELVQAEKIKAIQDENYQLASEKLASVFQALSKDMKL